MLPLWLLGWAALAQGKRSSEPPLHLGLSEAELDSVFGVRRHEDVPDYEVFHPHLGLEDLRFTAFGEDFRVRLRPHDHHLVSPDVLSAVRDGNRSRLDPPGHLHRHRHCHFHGTILSHGNTTGSISACSSLRGSLILPSHFLVLSPLPLRLHSAEERRRPDSPQGKRHLVFKREAALSPREESVNAGLLTLLRKVPVREELVYKQLEEYSEFCDVADTALYRDLPAFNYSLPDIARRDSLYVFPNTDPLELEMALFLDAPLWEHFRQEFGEERAETELVEFSLALMNNVHILYQQPSLSPNIRITLVRYELWKAQPPALAARVHKSGQAQLLLDAFCQHQASRNPGTDSSDPAHWDHAVLLTGYDLYHTTSSVAGVAPVARMCDAQFTCSLVEGRHLGRSFVLAHEMGHNLGMVHDGVQNLCSRSCCLMSAVNGAGKTTWSPCSVRELNAYILALGEAGAPPNCLADKAQGLRRRSHSSDGRKPGQRFTADQQCAFFWGRDYRQEIPTGRSLSDICHILWCGNAGSTISTAHPALEGTWCGGQRWCRDGECGRWDQDERPAVIAGGWSAWAGHSASLCGECRLEGALRVRTERRFCDSPAPNNGGTECAGVSVRGLLCRPAEQPCRGLSKQRFGDRLCASFLTDRHAPDTQLSGRSYLHPTSTCKIWCHLAGSDLIRNKARFPDGTPCEGGFCVSGQCMDLACDKEAIVAESGDCPLSSRSSRSRPSSWGAWEVWAPCSATCGLGSRFRERGCPTPGACGSSSLGRSEEACSAGTCALWSTWGTWTTCSATCGSAGRRRRSRTCAAGLRCSGSSLEQSDCPFVQACPREASWTGWSGWSVCTATCGGGSKKRRRDCGGGSGSCPGAREDSATCSTQTCPSWSRWSAWGSCTRSCGTGEQRRRRVCSGGPGCPGIKAQDKYCNRQACPSFTEWSLWSVCSVTCGDGTKRRDRSCLPGRVCFAPTFQEEACASQRCPGGRRRGSGSWSGWSLWSPCSVSCGRGGLKTRRRSCSRSRRCFGQSEQTNTCWAPTCASSGGWSGWSEWGECSLTCGSSATKERRRSCSGSLLDCPGDTFDRSPCRDLPRCPVWSEWGVWGACSATCGPGSETRRRSCDDGVSPTLITDASLIQASKCAGPASQIRGCRQTRDCESGGSDVGFPTDSPRRLVTAAAKLSRGQPAEWSFWSAWSDCSVSCGQGFRERRRVCTEEAGCSGIRSQRLVCRAQSCLRPGERRAEWSEWSDWSGCSRDCGGGQRERSRQCVGRGSCPGGRIEVAGCNLAGCPIRRERWAAWEEWGQCSRTCGGGRRSRGRRCLEPAQWLCRGFTKEEEPCRDRPCASFKRSLPDVTESPDQSSTFAPFSTALTKPTPITESDDLGGGEKNTSIGEFPRWSEWSSWSGCSCYSRRMARRRFCRVFDPQILGFCIGRVLDEAECDPSGRSCAPVPGGWSGWSEWSECSQDCGERASRIRYRVCAEPFPINRGPRCVGKSFDKGPCERLPECNGTSVDGAWSDWTAWAPCSATCGLGHKSRTRHCDAPRPTNGGLECLGPDFDLQKCREFDCPTTNASSSSWSRWTAWSGCSAECGRGWRRRERRCDGSSGLPCQGLAAMRKLCTLTPCPNATDGGWSPWAAWSGCESNCGVGQQTRSRSCSSPSPSGGGLRCSGPSGEGRGCRGRPRDASPAAACLRSALHAESLESLAALWDFNS